MRLKPFRLHRPQCHECSAPQFACVAGRTRRAPITPTRTPTSFVLMPDVEHERKSSEVLHLLDHPVQRASHNCSDEATPYEHHNRHSIIWVIDPGAP